jgi:hypothetical protein
MAKGLLTGLLSRIKVVSRIRVTNLKTTKKNEKKMSFNIDKPDQNPFCREVSIGRTNNINLKTTKKNEIYIST